MIRAIVESLAYRGLTMTTVSVQPTTSEPNECETFDLWFQRQQGVAYAGMYTFAKASYQHQQEIITNLEENLQQIVADNVQLQAKLNVAVEALEFICEPL
jgi:membrane carboxypeptidase/penicillin-binding protein PbpC